MANLPSGGRILPRGPSFGPLTDQAVAQMRHCGSGDALVATHLMQMLGEVTACVPNIQQEPLREQAATLLLEMHRTIRVARDICRVAGATV